MPCFDAGKGCTQGHILFRSYSLTREDHNNHVRWKRNDEARYNIPNPGSFRGGQYRGREDGAYLDVRDGEDKDVWARICLERVRAPRTINYRS